MSPNAITNSHLARGVSKNNVSRKDYFFLERLVMVCSRRTLFFIGFFF